MGSVCSAGCSEARLDKAGKRQFVQAAESVRRVRLGLSPTGAELLFEVFSQRYERGSVIVTSNLPFDEWTSVFGSERPTGALLDRLTHHVHILEMNGDSYRLRQSRHRRRAPRSDASQPQPG